MYRNFMNDKFGNIMKSDILLGKCLLLVCKQTRWVVIQIPGE